MYHTIQTHLKSDFQDTTGKNIAAKCSAQLGIETGNIRTAMLYTIDYALSDNDLHQFAEQCLKNTITEEVSLNSVHFPANMQSLIAVAQLPGVTDDIGTSAQMALSDFLNTELDLNVQHIFTQKLYSIENQLPVNQLLDISKSFLGNPLINHIQTFGQASDFAKFTPFVPKVEMQTDETVELINLNISDEELIKLSQDKILALSLDELHAIKSYYENPEIQAERTKLGLPEHPTDVELEVFAQTWSEHCKHKEFNAKIEYKNLETGETKHINSLFKTYIKGSTDVVKKYLQENDNQWLIKVFNDNAGLVQATAEKMFAWKVETHNSPSALDPYGGAITGILGVNRDIMGTGIGGAELLFNTNVLCFGSPNYDKPLLKGQLHPRRIMDGVVSGIEDGGNKSGIPTVNGAVIFDDRYAGKPLVFCGTGGLLPNTLAGRKADEKRIDVGDRIIMAGGRVGKDGIHGATFSSTEINEKSPMSAVQIGSPITQKKLSDFMIVAARKGLIKSSTDNGAGGLSSSIGELAEITNGAIVHLDKVPLKYSGLKPWEIFVSESQERMSIVVENQYLAEFFKLASYMEVEVTDIGEFTASGNLEIRYKNKIVGYLDLDFLHNGVPQIFMPAEWNPAKLSEPNIPENLNYTGILEQLLSSLNICSREEIIRKYDHEVKGKSVLKPLMGAQGTSPQDAAVMRFEHDSYEGIAVSNGIQPKFGDIDAYEMSCGAFDEAVRQIIAVGGILPATEKGDDIFWTVNDNFCVPDSLFHPEKNPDGKEKMAKLVQMCEGLYDMATFFNIPMTSGKDSMKNDFKAEGVKISVPPTILYSMASKIPDVRRTITSDFKAVGDLIYQVGETFDELGGSEFYKLFGETGANVPRVRKKQAKELYLKMMQANKDLIIESAHDISDGGLAVALAECAIGTEFGFEVNLDSLPNELTINAKLFAESQSRFVVTVRPENKNRFKEIFGHRVFPLGYVAQNMSVNLKTFNQLLINSDTKNLSKKWSVKL